MFKNVSETEMCCVETYTKTTAKSRKRDAYYSAIWKRVYAIRHLVLSATMEVECLSEKEKIGQNNLPL